tara:strand:+ start:531 stop:920 length:390 start_codon:yes stop_codon:yes gene_type:complete
MKKLSFIFLIFSTIIIAGDISPVISIRYDQIDNNIEVTDAIGLQFDLGNKRFTGFDTDGTDYRIYIGWRFGKIGLGHDGLNPEYTIGATYDIIDNIAMDLDFIMADDNSNSIRIGLNINFGVMSPIPDN